MKHLARKNSRKPYESIGRTNKKVQESLACAEIAKRIKRNTVKLSPCEHLAITGTPLLRTAAKSPAKVADV